MSLRDIITSFLFGRPAPLTRWQLENQLAAKAAQNPEKLDWRNSIVDLLKLIGMDSSLMARKALALRFGYGGSMADSAAMNIWLHQKVMDNLAANDGVVNL